MSDSHPDGAPQHGHAAQKETDEKMVNGKVEAHEKHVDGDAGDGVDMGDIGNPPRQSINQTPVTKEEHTPTNPPTPTNPTISPSTPSNPTTPAMDDTNNVATNGERRGSTPHNNDDDSGESESTNSTIESSPAPMKRAFVLSGREHEDTDDFLLSTMLAIRTAVCFTIPALFIL